VGPGIYLAQDPLISRSYGGRNWVLYGATLRKGSRYLSFFDIEYNKESIRHKTSGKVKQAGCSATAYWTLFSISTFLIPDQTVRNNWQKIRMALLKNI